MPSDLPLPISQFIIFLLCLTTYILFSCIETALISINNEGLKLLAGDNNKKADKLLLYLDNPKRYNYIIKLVTVFSGFLASAVSTLLFLNCAENFFNTKLHISSQTVSLLPIVLANMLIFLAIGEFFPKRIAKRYSEHISLFLIDFILFVDFILSPLVFLVDLIVNIMLIITRQSNAEYEGDFSEEKIKSMLEVGQETGVLGEGGKRMINSIFDFDDKQAYEAMTPRTDVFYIDINDPTDEYIDELMELRYSRIPVYEDDNDNIIGILNIKDYLIQAKNQGFENVDIRSILRKPYFVPETKKLDTLFFELQNSKQHIAILIDEYGGFSGIVTMEDIIEQVMGNIDDEYDDEDDSIVKLDEHTFMLDGFMSLKDINEEIGIELESENSETLGGLLIDVLGEIPGDGENLHLHVEIENLRFTIISVKERRIEKVKLEILQEEENQDNDQELQK